MKQHSKEWYNAKSKRIGSSEIFDIVRYYASDQELHNCGFDPVEIHEEIPFTTAFQLFRKLTNSPFYSKKPLEPESAKFGLAAEKLMRDEFARDHNGLVCQQGRVVVLEHTIASLDSEIKVGDDYELVEHKTVRDNLETWTPTAKYIIQCQFQLMHVPEFARARIQAMNLFPDTAFNRGLLYSCKTAKQMREVAKKNEISFRFKEYPMEKLPAVIALCKACMDRFLQDVRNKIEPQPFLADGETPKSILASVAINGNMSAAEVSLKRFLDARDRVKACELEKQAALQEIINLAREKMTLEFIDPETGEKAAFSKAGALLIKTKKEYKKDL